MKSNPMMSRWIGLRRLLCGVILMFSAHAYACDPSGPPPSPWPAEQAAREMLLGKSPEFTHVLYGTFSGEDEQASLYIVDVAHTFRGGLKGRLRVNRYNVLSWHSSKPRA